MRAVRGALGEPQQQLRVVHIAGSKGKGSTAAMLAAVLRAAGLRTGLFTSPHLSAVEERIQIDERPVSPVELAVLRTESRARMPADFAPAFFHIGAAPAFPHLL